MIIGIFAQSADIQAHELSMVINEFDSVSCEIFDLELIQSADVLLEPDGIFWRGMNLTEMDLIYIRGFSYMNPVIPPRDDQKDWSMWQADYLVEQQKFSFCFSLFREMERRGVRLVNSTDGLISIFMKYHMLENIRRAGFLVPDLISSNEMDKVKDFTGKNEFTLWRPSAGRAAWQLFYDKQREFLIRSDKPAVLLAEGVKGPVVRSYIFQKETLLMLKYHSPCRLPPEKLEQFFPVEDKQIEDELANLLNVCKLDWALVYFVLKDDRPWIFDIDADPLISFLPEVYKKYLNMRFAYCLAGQKFNNIDFKDFNAPQERSTIFLRRMMQVLFDFEDSKYLHK